LSFKKFIAHKVASPAFSHPPRVRWFQLNAKFTQTQGPRPHILDGCTVLRLFVHMLNA